MSGFAQMAGALARVGELHSVAKRGKPVSTVKKIRQALIEGAKTSAELEALLKVRNQQIWGCLKRDIAAGRVVRYGDYWVWQGEQENTHD